MSHLSALALKPVTLTHSSIFRIGRAQRPVTTGDRIKGFLGVYWRSIIVVACPVLFSYIMFSNHDESLVKAFRCLYIVCVVS